ncbi:acyl-ACP thioesterase-domain-containing protein [Scenedesmus sp. NREL 46B-D3]|nr:acyl-ACP thioesterase-domain-containing protein [Scenedesmus sp. NREL 46B-D3]
MLRQRQAAALSAPCIPQLRLHRCLSPEFRASRSIPCATSVAATTEASVAAPAVAHRVLSAPKEACFNEDCTVFIEEFRIRGNEAGPDQRANIITIANLFRCGTPAGRDWGRRTHPATEVGGNHGVAMWGRANSGFAAMPGMDHLIFVATRMQIRMEEYPKWGDVVRLETYFAEDGRLTTRRDWRITNAGTGEFLGAATSTWVTINAESRRLAKIPEKVKQRFLQLSPSPPRCAIPTSDTRRKLPEFVWPPQVRPGGVARSDSVVCTAVTVALCELPGFAWLQQQVRLVGLSAKVWGGGDADLRDAAPAAGCGSEPLQG